MGVEHGVCDSVTPPLSTVIYGDGRLAAVVVGREIPGKKY